MSKLKIALASFALIAFASVGFAQQQGLWGNFPIIGGASYCASTVNGVCRSTIPAGPAKTGSETAPVNTNATSGPATALMSMADLNANPINFSTATAAQAATPISASNISGGVVYSSTGNISSANITLPSNAVQGQQYSISSNRTITTLNVSAASGDSMASNSSPTTLTASTTAPQGYNFICNKAGGSTCTWYRLR